MYTNWHTLSLISKNIPHIFMGWKSFKAYCVTSYNFKIYMQFDSIHSEHSLQTNPFIKQTIHIFKTSIRRTDIWAISINEDADSKKNTRLDKCKGKQKLIKISISHFNWYGNNQQIYYAFTYSACWKSKCSNIFPKRTCPISNSALWSVFIFLSELGTGKGTFIKYWFKY